MADGPAFMEDNGVHRLQRGGTLRQLVEQGDDSLFAGCGDVQTAEPEPIGPGQDVGQIIRADIQLGQIDRAIGHPHAHGMTDHLVNGWCEGGGDGVTDQPEQMGYRFDLFEHDVPSSLKCTLRGTAGQ